MSDNTYPSDYPNLIDIEADNLPSGRYHGQEQNILGRQAFVSTFTLAESPRERVTSVDRTEDRVLSGEIRYNAVSSEHQYVIDSSRGAEEESSPFGSLDSKKYEALATSASSWEHRRERSLESIAFPPNSRTYNDPYLQRHGQATSNTCVEHTRLLQPWRKSDTSQMQNLEAATTLEGATGGTRRTITPPRNIFEVHIKRPKYREYKVRLKSFKGHTRKWPHMNPSAEDMAQANFIYRGSDQRHDAVECYLCGNTFQEFREADVVDTICDCNLELDRNK